MSPKDEIRSEGRSTRPGHVRRDTLPDTPNPFDDPNSPSTSPIYVRTASARDYDASPIELPVMFHVRALYDYRSTANDDFDFDAGDVIAVTATGRDGWWRGGHHDDTKRLQETARVLLPSNFVSGPIDLSTPEDSDGVKKPVLFYVRALHDYSAQGENEFDFLANDIIAVFETGKDGWWNGLLLDKQRRVLGRTLFPSNFVRGLSYALDI